MKKQAANARAARLSATMRMIETHGDAPEVKPEAITPKTHKAKVRYMVPVPEVVVSHA